MKIKALLITLVCFFTTGCWNYHELNEFSIVTGMGIDKENNTYTVTLMVVNAQSTQLNTKEGKAQTTVLTGMGKTISEAMKKAELDCPDDIYMGHLETLVISDKIATENIYNILDPLFRNSETVKKYYLVLAKDTKAQDVLEIISPSEIFPAKAMTQLIKNASQNQGVTSEVSLGDFMYYLVNQGIQGYLPSVYIEKSNDVNSENEEEEEEEGESKGAIRLGPVGLFRGGNLVGWASDDETQGINIINNNAESIFLINEFEDGNIIVDLSDLKSSKKVVFNNGIPEIEIKVKGAGKIKELNADIDLNDSKVSSDLIKKTNNELKKIIASGIRASKEKYQTDVLGFGKLIYQKDFRYWYDIKDNWDLVGFRDIKVNVSTEIDLKIKGVIKNLIKEK